MVEQQVTDDFGDESVSSLPMEIGDAVAYPGVTRRHGRAVPNINGSSAHLFLHWVDRDGPHAAQAFDGAGVPPRVNLSFVRRLF